MMTTMLPTDISQAELTFLRQRVAELEQQVQAYADAAAALRLDEARLEALLRLEELTDAPLQELTHFALEEGIRLTESTVGYLAFLNPEETVLTMYSWSKSAMKACQIQDKPIEYVVANVGLWGEPVRLRCPVVTNDYAAPNPAKKGYPAGHIAITRHLGVPVIDNGRVVLVAGVGNKVQDYNDSDVRQMMLLMSGMWRIVQHKRAEEERARLQDEIIQMQAVTLAELSTPFIPINDQVIVMPLVGTVDSARAQQIMTTLLEGISSSRAQVAIIDITGVRVIDTQVANALVRAAQATRLLGAQVILTGISPEVAQTLVQLGVDLSGVITQGSLQKGIAYATVQMMR